MNYYELLDVKPSATPEEIRLAYHNLIKAFHPDYYKGSTEYADKKSKEINEAYSVLKDPIKRKEYDNYLRATDDSSMAQQEAERARQDAQDARQKQAEAEEMARQEHERFQEEEQKRKEAEEKAEQVQNNINQSDNSKHVKSEITLKTTLLHILVIIGGYAVWHGVALLTVALISLIAKIPVLGVVILWLASFPYDIGLGLTTLITWISCFCAYAFSQWLTNKSNQPQYRWGYRTLSIILCIEQIINTIEGTATFWNTVNVIFIVLLVMFAGKADSSKKHVA